MGTYENDEDQPINLKNQIAELTTRLLQKQEDDNESIRVSLEQFHEYGRLKIWYNKSMSPPLIDDEIARMLFEDICQHQKDHKWPFKHYEGFGLDNLVTSLMAAYTHLEAQHEFADAIVKQASSYADGGDNKWGNARRHLMENFRQYMKKRPLPDNTPLEINNA